MPRRTLLITIILVGSLTAACASQSPVQPQITFNSGGGSTLSTGTRGTDPIVELVERVRPAVVNVSTDALVSDGAFSVTPGGGTGTGFIIRSDGIVVTNYHVVEGARQITVATLDPDSKRFDARVIGGDESADVAVLKIEARGLPTVDLGSSDDLRLGERVVAIGYALALDGGPTVTTGIVSALDRVVSGVQDPNCEDCALENGVPTRTYGSVIQTDAAINPGNSGGPLLNLAGEVVGINSAGVGAGQADNIGFSIAMDSAKATIQHAIDHPSAPQAYLGVVTYTVSPEIASDYGLAVESGAYVIETAPGGPADKAGIEAGDVMVDFDGSGVRTNDDFAAAIDRSDPGDVVEIELIRGDDEDVRVTVTLGSKPLP